MIILVRTKSKTYFFILKNCRKVSKKTENKKREYKEIKNNRKRSFFREKMSIIYFTGHIINRVNSFPLGSRDGKKFSIDLLVGRYFDIENRIVPSATSEIINLISQSFPKVQGN